MEESAWRGTMEGSDESQGERECVWEERERESVCVWGAGRPAGGSRGGGGREPRENGERMFGVCERRFGVKELASASGRTAGDVWTLLDASGRLWKLLDA